MRLIQTIVLALTGLALSGPARAQMIDGANNLAPYVPSPQVVVERMLEAAGLKPGEMLYDLGAGDGRVVITAAQKFKARAVGVELSPELCKRAAAQVKALGLSDQVSIIHADLLTVDLRPADVVTLYLLTSSNDRLKPNLEKYLKPGARVVSHDFVIRGWKPARTEHVESGSRVHKIYVYQISEKLKP
jgi:cyclopropane fatty-acyl-phospholipid synthase-like methyltransferase